MNIFILFLFLTLPGFLTAQELNDGLYRESKRGDLLWVNNDTTILLYAGGKYIFYGTVFNSKKILPLKEKFPFNSTYVIHYSYFSESPLIGLTLSDHITGLIIDSEEVEITLRGYFKETNSFSFKKLDYDVVDNQYNIPIPIESFAYALLDINLMQKPYSSPEIKIYPNKSIQAEVSLLPRVHQIPIHKLIFKKKKGVIDLRYTNEMLYPYTKVIGKTRKSYRSFNKIEANKLSPFEKAILNNTPFYRL